MERKLTTEEKIRLLSGVGWWHTYEVLEAELPALFLQVKVDMVLGSGGILKERLFEAEF